MLKFIFITLILIVYIIAVGGFLVAVELSDQSAHVLYVTELVLYFIASSFVYRKIFLKFIKNLGIYPLYLRLLIVLSPVWMAIAIVFISMYISDYIL